MIYTFNIDGYDFGERTLEGVMFAVTVDTKTEQVIDFALAAGTWENDQYLKGLNKDQWLKTGRDHAGDVVADVFAIIDTGASTAEEIFNDLNPDGTLEF